MMSGTNSKHWAQIRSQQDRGVPPCLAGYRSALASRPSAKSSCTEIAEKRNVAPTWGHVVLPEARANQYAIGVPTNALRASSSVQSIAGVIFALTAFSFDSMSANFSPALVTSLALTVTSIALGVPHASMVS